MTKLETYLFENITLMVIFLLFLFPNISVAQDPLFERAEKFVNSNPDETIKIGELLLKRELSEEDEIKIKLLVTKSHYNKANYDNALQYAFEVNPKPQTENYLDVLLIKSNILRDLYLHKQADKYIMEAENQVKNLKLPEIELWESKINKNKIKVLIDRQLFSEALEKWNITNSKNSTSISKDSCFNQKWNIQKADIFKQLNNLDSVEYYLKKAVKISDNNSIKENRIIILIKMSGLLFERKEYQKAIDSLFIAEKLAFNLGNNFLSAQIQEQLSNNYLALNNKKQHEKSYKNFLTYSTNNEKTEIDAINMVYNLINKEQEQIFEVKEKEYKNYIKFSSWLLGIIFIIGLIFWYKNKVKLRHQKEILKYLEASDNVSLKQTKTETEKQKRTSAIPVETEQILLAKLKRFESSSKFTNKDMSLANLAAQFDTNTKYLSEIINKHYNDNFNTYINRLRINYIIDKLKTDSNYLNYKISYLAEQSGFSSHSSFATVFKSITGIAPTTFIDIMNKELKKQQNNDPE